MAEKQEYEVLVPVLQYVRMRIAAESADHAHVMVVGLCLGVEAGTEYIMDSDTLTTVVTDKAGNKVEYLPGRINESLREAIASRIAAADAADAAELQAQAALPQGNALVPSHES